ncbi:MAG TPA: C-GCAxxG-C-C family protein [Candidatus Cloacimonadota bacterium]|nr:C-GCAxxG-C-C family protein [Candidatus Cloacimonadota bacterium]HPT72638.1 C-GCAxxG-C-C family protein [Candidatus Cloacimonadota bacterium]
MDFTAKIKQAMQDLDNGYNCAQSVFRQFCEEFGLSKDFGTRVSAGFGTGLKMARTCGALSGGVMAIGLMHGNTSEDCDAKENLNDLIIQFIAYFKEAYQTTDCRDLLGIDISKPGNRMKARESGVMDKMCPQCITTAIGIIQKIEENIDNQLNS